MTDDEATLITELMLAMEAADELIDVLFTRLGELAEPEEAAALLEMRNERRFDLAVMGGRIS